MCLTCCRKSRITSTSQEELQSLFCVDMLEAGKIKSHWMFSDDDMRSNPIVVLTFLYVLGLKPFL